MKILQFSEFTPEKLAECRSVFFVEKKIVFGECVYADGILVKNGELIRLTPIEDKLLRFLEDKDDWVSTDELAEKVWGKKASIQTMHIAVKQINTIFDGKFILNKYRHGYMLDKGI